MQSYSNDFIDLLEEVNPPTGNVFLKDLTPLNVFIRDFMINIHSYTELKLYLDSNIIRIECKISEIGRYRYINYDINQKHKKNIMDNIFLHFNRLGGINSIISKCDYLEKLYIYDSFKNKDMFLTEKLENVMSSLYISFIYNCNFSFLTNVKDDITIECFNLKDFFHYDYIEMLNCDELIIKRFELIKEDIDEDHLQYFIDSFNILVYNVKIIQIDEIISYKSFVVFSSFLRTIRDSLSDKLNSESINKYLIY